MAIHLLAQACAVVKFFCLFIPEIDMYGFLQARLLSHGRYGRTKEIILNLPKELADKLRQVVLTELGSEPYP